MRKITFIGGIGKENEFGGELLKNKIIVARMKGIGYQVNIIDTYKSHHSLYKGIIVIARIIQSLLFRRKDVFVLSTSFGNIYGLIKIMHYLPFRYDIVNWVIGSSLNKRVKSNSINVNFLSHIRMHVVEAECMKKELMDSLGITNIKVAYNFRTINPLPEIQKKEDGKMHFLFFSRITPSKGVDIILSAVSILNRDGYELKYDIDFYGEIEPDFEQEFSNSINNNENLKYCKTIQLRERKNYDVLAKYHYMLFPTYWHGEGFPGAIIDCYIAGVPIIASNWGYISEFIEDGKTGKVIPSQNVEALVKVMKDAIEGRMNCLEMSRFCQRKAQEFDTKFVLSDTLLHEIGGLS